MDMNSTDIAHDIMNEYIDIMKRGHLLNDIMDMAAYRWIRDNVGILDMEKFHEQGSKAYINKAYCQIRPDDELLGFDWKFDSYKDPKFVIITYTTIMNESGKYKTDNEVTLSLKEFEDYIY